MSAHLEQMLRDYAKENGDLQDETLLNDDIRDENILGAEEITVVTDNTMSTLEEALEETSEKVERMKDNDVAGEKVAEAVDGLETLEARLVQMALEGRKLDSTAMEFFNASVIACLESRSIPAEFYMADVMQVQSSFESGQIEDYTAEAQELIAGPKEPAAVTGGKTGILSKLYNLLKSIGASIATAFTEFVASLSKSASAIKTSGEKLKRIGGKLKGNAKEGKITSVYGDPADAVQKTLDGFKGVEILQGNINTAIDGITSALSGGRDLSGNGLSATSVDVGIATLKFTPGSGDGAASLGGAKFSADKKASGGAGTSIDPLTPAEIVALGGKLVAVAKVMTDLSTSAKASVAKTNQILKAAGTAAGKDANLTAEQRKTQADNIKAAQAAVRATKGLMPLYVSQLGTVAKAAYKVGMQSASKYKGDGAAIPMGQDKPEEKK